VKKASLVTLSKPKTILYTKICHLLAVEFPQLFCQLTNSLTLTFNHRMLKNDANRN